MQVLATVILAALSLLGMLALLLAARSGGLTVVLPLIVSRSAKLVMVTSEVRPPGLARARILPPRAPPISLHSTSHARLAKVRE